jgi:class 3 adenylate cyclase/predicted ATPase
VSFYDLVDKVVELLQRRGRLSYRSLKLEFGLDDPRLDALKFELVDVQGVAADRDGTLLVWTGTGATPPSGEPAPTPSPRGAVETPAPEASVPTVDADAERRQLTVLFCDLAGSTALSAELDPEELREVLDEYQTACAGVIERFGGVIARQVGDGLLVNFGYPLAYEDDAGRAVRAGLAIAAALPELNGGLARRFPPLRGRPLQVRIGLHTGLAVVGALGASTYRDPMAVVGETPNIAARLQGLAEPDEVVVSGATRRLLGDAFICEDRGLHQLKGVAAPVPVFRVLRERDAPESAAAAATRFTPLVGREQEVGVLLDRWEQTKEGEGQIVLLSGDAGIGKSRLVQELKAHVADEPHIRLEGRGSPYHQQSAFYPIVDLLRQCLPFDRGDSPEAKLEKLAAALARYRLPADEMLPAFAALLGLPAPAARAALAVGPQQRRQETLSALVALVLHLAAQQPVLMIIEDLHWSDPSTLEVLELLLEQALTVRLLLVLTARPEFRVPWGTRPHLTRLTLTRLRRAQVERLAAAVTGGKALPAEVLEQVAHKTDGVPLFVEELTKMVLESGWVREAAAGYELAGPLPPLAIPATLQDSLMARLDRLATTKVVVQVGATLGRSFSYEVLEAVTGLDEATLKGELGKLVEAELLYQRGHAPDATYSFKHALIQDAAYQTLLRSTRQQYHKRVAQVLEARFPDTLETQPELLAHHYTQAGLGHVAVPYWHRAGSRAIERSANHEGIAHLSRGLELLPTLPDDPDRVRRELDIQTTLALALMATRGYAAPEAEAAYGRARELCRQLGDTSRLVRVLLSLVTHHLFRADYRAARDLAAECLPLTQGSRDVPRLRQAHLGQGNALYHLGEFASAQAHFEQVVALVEPPGPRPRGIPALADARVTCLSHIGKVLWLFGYPDRALERSAEALALAEELAHPHTVAVLASLTAWFHMLRGEVATAQEWAERSGALCREGDFRLWLAQSHVVRGWARARQGQEEGIAELREGMQGWRATGAVLARPTHLALLAESCGRAGRPEEGLALIGEALAAIEKTDERWGEAEIHRIRGELLATAAEDGGEEAEACLRRALEVARRQQARSLELRAATALARLWDGRGRRQAARRLLGPTYQWFSEGWATPDLRDARAVLDALA